MFIGKQTNIKKETNTQSDGQWTGWLQRERVLMLAVNEDSPVNFDAKLLSL